MPPIRLTAAEHQAVFAALIEPALHWRFSGQECPMATGEI